MMKYLKKHGWIAGMAILVDVLAIKYWQSYLATGSVHDGKHDVTFVGEATIGHLAGTTLGAIVLTYFFIQSLVKFNRE
jgi:hypothetical protein